MRSWLGFDRSGSTFDELWPKFGKTLATSADASPSLENVGLHHLRTDVSIVPEPCLGNMA